MTQVSNGRSLTGLGLVGAGLLFIFAQIFNINLFGALWPLFIIVPGLAFLYFAATGGKKQSGLAVPGSLITGTGLILMVQSLTGHWASWAYAWTLYPVFLGMALSYIGQRMGDNNTYKTGQGFVKFGGAAFIVSALLFELVLFGGGGILGGLAVPLLLIAGGLFMMANRSNGKRKTDEEPLFVGAKLKNDYSDRLRQKIDAALAEDEEEPQHAAK